MLIGIYLYEATGSFWSRSNSQHSIRPIVFLSSSIEIEKNDTYDGSTKEKACRIK